VINNLQINGLSTICLVWHLCHCRWESTSPWWRACQAM